MVAFCSKCGTSLPYADLVVREGDEAIAHYYRCPECKQLANPPSEDAEEKQEFELSEDSEMMIRQGESATQPASPDEPAAQPPEGEAPPPDENASQEPQ